MIIALSGTPGTGKHTLAARLKADLDYDVLDVGDLIKRGGLTAHVSIRDLNLAVGPLLKENSVVISHMAHFLRSPRIDFFVVLRCDPLVLIKRLKKRGYKNKKIYDNALFEAIDGTYIEAIELHKNVVQIDNTHSIKKSITLLRKLIEENKVPKPFKKDYSRRIRTIEKLV